MNKNFIAALVALCALAGHTINLTAESNPEDFEEAVKKVGEKMTALSTSNIKLTADVADLEKKQKDAAEKAVDDLLAEAVNDKILTADQVPSWKEFGLVNLSAMTKNLKSMKPATLIAMPVDKTKTPVAGREAWTFDDYALNAPVDLELMETSDPEKFKLLLSAKQNSVRQKHSIEA